MCQSALHPFLQALPKCEHHIHLEGSLSPKLLFQLAASHNINLPSPLSDPAFTSPATLEARYENFTSLDDFLHYYFIAQSVLRIASDYELLAYEYFLRAHADGVHHAELFFDPQAHTSRGVPYAVVVEGFTRAQARAEQDFAITSELILCFLRHLPVEFAKTTLEEALAMDHFSDGTLVGIGLDSSEADFPPEMFRDVYRSAAQKGIRCTAHAGEEGDSSYIWRALDECKVQRIDHGIRLVDDKDLMRRVAEDQTLVTVCPLSNVRLHCIPSVKDLPLREFLDHGVRFSINSDDPAYFGGYILDNYCAVQDAFDFSIDEWRGIAHASILGSWCDDAKKAELIRKVDDCMTIFKKSDIGKAMDDG